MTSHRMIGLNPDIIGIYKSEYYRLPIEKFPDEIYTVYTNSGHGGHRLKRAVEKADYDDGWRVDRIYQQNIGGYNMHIHHAYKLQN